MQQLDFSTGSLEQAAAIVHLAHARNVRTGYGASVVQPKHQRANRDSPAYWIAEACTRARERAELAPIEVAVAVFNRKGKVVDATTVLRFEKGKRYPDLLDELVEGYARKTGRDAPDLWMDAILLWRQYRAHPISGVAEDPDPPEDADAA